jgi:hypothetical protein
MPFVTSLIGNMPQNQINALPLISADTAAAGGAISIVGGNFTRYWSPTVLGLVGVQPAAAGGATFWMFSGFLDTRGVRAFKILVRRLNGAALGANTAAIVGSIQIFQQFRFTSAEVPLLSQGATENLSSLAINTIANSGIGGFFPALQTQNEVQTAAFGWDSPLGDSAAGNNANVTIGTDVRIMVGFQNLPNVNNTWSVALWGRS